MWSLLLINAVFIFTYMSIVFCIATARNKVSAIDVAWGLGFVVIVICSFIFSRTTTIHSKIVSMLVALWGLRLSTHVLLRNWNKNEDPRYAKLIAQWGTHPLLKIYVRIFMTQALLMLVIGLPIVISYTQKELPLGAINYVGIFIWIVGFLFELIGDYQLSRFLKNPANNGRVMNEGLWRYTRHPNYFGEIAIWWGIFLIVATGSYGIFTLISPLTITFLLLRVSGIPLIEKQFEANPAYQEYKMHTNMLIPWFPKK